MGAANDKPQKRTLVIALVVAVCLVGAGLGIAHILGNRADNKQVTQQVQPVKEKEPKLVKNPKNFKKLRKKNKDIYAWIRVPGTGVDYAVLQHPKINDYYLSHDEYKNPSAIGAVFSEKFNTKDFQDAVTVLYGHNCNKRNIFGTLHRFEDKSFFNKHKKFYIYTPGHIYTYKIACAFTNNDRHVLYEYGYFQKYKQLRKFEKKLKNPKSILQHTRRVKLDDNSKIVVLSTCNTGAPAEYGRFLVCGVMVKDQLTK